VDPGESVNGASEQVVRQEKGRDNLRNDIAILSVVQLAVLTWMLIDRARAGSNADPDLAQIVFLGALLIVLVVARLQLGDQFVVQRRGLGFLCGVAVTVSIISLWLVDYESLSAGGLRLPVVLVVPIVLALFRRRR